jgi:two-component system sensor histidine kinase RegB
MSDFDASLLEDGRRSNWVRLRTLVVLRWAAVIGQIAAILGARYVYDMEFEFALAVTCVAVSVVANIVTTVVYPESRRLSEREATLMLVFDVLQLALLLYLTGGLNNPFALLMLAPVTIAATLLPVRSTVLLGGLAVGLISALAIWYLPITSAQGDPLILPRLFQFGFWIALSIGVVFLAIYARQVTTEIHVMREGLVATQLALAREQKLTDLGGVIAAAAHELGTPLATIKLVAGELLQELADRPDQREDAELIRSQADRCRDILRSMGQAIKDDPHLRSAPIESVVKEAAEPHLGRGVELDFAIALGLRESAQPAVLRKPEIIHGLRNLIQNAVDFAETAVDIETAWTDTAIIVRIEDDGPGFPSSVFGRIGDPFMRRSRGADTLRGRPGYEGMGLGLFIAKTLLERTGARLSFTNSSGVGGAIVVVEWPRSRIEFKDSSVSGTPHVASVE